MVFILRLISCLNSIVNIHLKFNINDTVYNDTGVDDSLREQLINSQAEQY